MKLNIVPYSLDLPENAEVLVSVGMGNTTHWQINIGRFQLFIHLNSRENPEYLGDFILSCTKQQVELTPVEINGIRGVTYGTYNSARSWIDWWLKKGDVMICINLQAYCSPTPEEKTLHSRVIGSLSYEV